MTRGKIATAAEIAPFAALAVCGSIFSGPTVALAAGLGASVLATHAQTLWSRCCGSFVGSEELRQNPLQYALRETVEQAISSVETAWWQTPLGQQQQRQAINFAQQPAHTTKHVFRRLRDELDRAITDHDTLQLFAAPENASELGADEQATLTIFNEFIDTKIVPPEMPRALANFIKQTLPAELAKAFAQQVQSSPEVRQALGQIIQRYQTSILEDLHLQGEQRIQLEQGFKQQLEALRENQDQLFASTLEHLRTISNLGEQTHADVQRLLTDFEEVQANKANIFPASDLLGDLTNLEDDIFLAKWQPDREVVLPFEGEAFRIFNTEHILAIKGRPSSGKTHLAVKLLRQLPDALVISSVELQRRTTTLQSA